MAPNTLKQIFIGERGCATDIIEVHDKVIVEGGDRIHVMLTFIINLYHTDSYMVARAVLLAGCHSLYYTS